VEGAGDQGASQGHQLQVELLSRRDGASFGYVRWLRGLTALMRKRESVCVMCMQERGEHVTAGKFQSACCLRAFRSILGCLAFLFVDCHHEGGPLLAARQATHAPALEMVLLVSAFNFTHCKSRIVSSFAFITLHRQ